MILRKKNRKKAQEASRTMLDSLDALIAEHHLLKHPFYQAWSEGKLSRKTLQLYAQQYYQHVRAFPENLEQLAERSTGSLKEIVGDNLAEEVDSEAPHPALWRQFAESIGVTGESLDNARPLPGVAALLDTFDEIASQASLTQAVASFYAYEAQVPETSAEKIAGLRRFYDVTEPRGLAYFEVHETADVRHRAAWRGWLASQNEEDTFGVLCAAERTLRALWAALDAVYAHESAKN
jgi:pyrroloquinoline-quinone synthase